MGEAEDSVKLAARAATALIRQDDAITGFSVAVCGFTDPDMSIGYTATMYGRYQSTDEQKTAYHTALSVIMSSEDQPDKVAEMLSRGRGLIARLRLAWIIVTNRSHCTD
jgi:hypothetical protein